MHSILLSAGIMGGLGLFFGTALALAYRLLRVPEDPRLAEVETLLPGTNCGACGEPGCRGLAEKLVSGASAPSQCTVASPETIQELAALLGVDPGQTDKRVARVRCAGGHAQAPSIAVYQGLPSCRAAVVIGAGGKGCSWGCLGLADCVVACQFNAMTINGLGLPVVSVDRCTACGDCISACPRDLITIEPLRQRLFVQCNSPLQGAEARTLCEVACDACGRCVQDAPPGFIRLQDNLPLIDHAALVPVSPETTYRCPTGAIQWLEGEQFARPPMVENTHVLY